MIGELTALEQTALVPLVARANDARLAAPILGDLHASEVVGRLRSRAVDLPAVDSPTQIGCCARSRQFDRWVSGVRDSGGAAALTVVDLGVGLNTRAERLNLTGETYVEVDSAEMMQRRNELLPDSGAVRVAADVMVLESWSDHVPDDRPVLIVAEGVLMYQSPERVRQFLNACTLAFGTTRIAFDSVSGLGRWISNRPANRGDRPAYRWAVRRTSSLTVGDRQIEVLEERTMADISPTLVSSLGRAASIFYGSWPLNDSYRLSLARLQP